jgi:hypothetical protein
MRNCLELYYDDLMRALNRNGFSPLFLACYNGHVSCIEALIRLKSDVLQCDK